MLAEFFITFRETLEAALIVGIILMFLFKTKKNPTPVYFGVGAGVIGSVLIAIIFNLFLGGFEGVYEELFEGVVMIVASFFIAYVVFWMHRNNSSEKIEVKTSNKNFIGIFLLVFFSILREGVEIVLFLAAFDVMSNSLSLMGAVLGIFLALIIGYLLFYFGKKVHFKKLLMYLNILLAGFAIWLFYSGVHELIEILI